MNLCARTVQSYDLETAKLRREKIGVCGAGVGGGPGVGVLLSVWEWVCDQASLAFPPMFHILCNIHSSFYSIHCSWIQENETSINKKGLTDGVSLTYYTRHIE